MSVQRPHYDREGRGDHSGRRRTCLNQDVNPDDGLALDGKATPRCGVAREKSTVPVCYRTAPREPYLGL